MNCTLLSTRAACSARNSTRCRAAVAAKASVNATFNECRKNGRYASPKGFILYPHPRPHSLLFLRPIWVHHLRRLPRLESLLPQNSPHHGPPGPVFAAPPPPSSSSSSSSSCSHLSFLSVPPGRPCRIALIPFIMAGDPNLDITAQALLELDKLGADIIELGVPYSDPLADGRVIHDAATRALASGANVEKVLNVVREVSPKMKAPIVLFTYYNPIMARGMDNYCKTIKEAGASGLLVPDIPLEMTDDVREACRKAGIELVLLATPTTPQERMARIADKSQGFVYLVSVTGVTGVRAAVSDRVEGLVNMLKAVTDKPVAVGFGVSAPENVEQIVSWGADGVIVGSALVKALAGGSTPEQGLKDMVALASSLRAAAPQGK